MLLIIETNILRSITNTQSSQTNILWQRQISKGRMNHQQKRQNSQPQKKKAKARPEKVRVEKQTEEQAGTENSEMIREFTLMISKLLFQLSQMKAQALFYSLLLITTLFVDCVVLFKALALMYNIIRVSCLRLVSFTPYYHYRLTSQ